MSPEAMRCEPGKFSHWVWNTNRTDLNPVRLLHGRGPSRARDWFYRSGRAARLVSQGV